MSSVEFNALLVGNIGFLKPFAFQLTKDRESAKDLFQETITRALVHQEKYLEGTNIKAWLFTIMRNIFINNYRKNTKFRIIYNPIITDLQKESTKDSVANMAESVIVSKDLHSKLQTLPEIFKQPFQLYLDGYKYIEIAAILQEPLGTIKSRIHFARKNLRVRINRN
ncbi:RNA polymerase sigma factor [Chitinophaga sp. Cy-1792]|uniref:RNA polymerase sigma factor n=1 Tax=Chitinophaga sp. Cy-1792 TaxID=2608339 RepID=UPI001421DA52|nr:RNA polymerase sigma factor [Chitinophaga sp. Cy-1792]NIG52098.1 RNA polymerase sigma factor [Chitinophaga sp. Cy-1792]